VVVEDEDFFVAKHGEDCMVFSSAPIVEDDDPESLG